MKLTHMAYDIMRQMADRGLVERSDALAYDWLHHMTEFVLMTPGHNNMATLDWVRSSIGAIYLVFHLGMGDSSAETLFIGLDPSIVNVSTEARTGPTAHQYKTTRSTMNDIIMPALETVDDYDEEVFANVLLGGVGSLPEKEPFYARPDVVPTKDGRVLVMWIIETPEPEGATFPITMKAVHLAVVSGNVSQFSDLITRVTVMQTM